MTIKLFEQMRLDAATLRAERDLMETQLGVLQYRHLELIAGIKALNDMLLIKRPNTALYRACEDLVNRLVDMARKHHVALLADERAVANLRKATSNDP